MQTKQKEPQNYQHLQNLSQSYSNLSNGSKADLRRLESYQKIRHFEAFYSVQNEYEKFRTSETITFSYPKDVIASLLLYWRDRGAKEDQPSLDYNHTSKLGKLFVGSDHDNPIIKIGRFKRIMQAETLEDGFRELRKTLLIFRHDQINWGDVAELLSAWYSKKETRIDRQKRNLAEAYFSLIPLKTLNKG
ncbi:MAG: hypothetical protein ACI86H_002274 [bacterium]|jgi:hypothetical protein